MTFREYCAAAAMRELVRAASTRKQLMSEDEFCTDLAAASFAIADAMVKAAGPEPSRYGVAPSRSGGGE